jgi:MFS family permease
MLKRLRQLRQSYPRQFLLILAGLLISTTGSSLIWPFLTIYVSEKLSLPLTEIAALITLSGAVALAASFVAGPITDFAGRKWIMVISLLGMGATYIFLSQAATFAAFAVLMALRGLFQPLYWVGTQAMVTDLVEPKQRPEAFALIRMSDNLGIAIGPALGGLIIVVSYTIGFAVAAAALILFGLVIAIFARETIPEAGQASAQTMRLSGYMGILRDGSFMRFISAFTLFKTCSVMLWVLFGVYAKQNYELLESQIGLIQATNAAMVVLFQVAITRRTSHRPPLPVMAAGAMIYSLGVTSIAIGQGFWAFWLSYVVLTIGELIILPTASSYVADQAPADQRGRYMSFFSLSQGSARTVAPVVGGAFNDNLGPQFIWLGAGTIGLIGTLGLAILGRRDRRTPQGALQQPSTTD